MRVGLIALEDYSALCYPALRGGLKSGGTHENSVKDLFFVCAGM